MLSVKVLFNLNFSILYVDNILYFSVLVFFSAEAYVIRDNFYEVFLYSMVNTKEFRDSPPRSTRTERVLARDVVSTQRLNSLARSSLERRRSNPPDDVGRHVRRFATERSLPLPPDLPNPPGYSPRNNSLRGAQYRPPLLTNPFNNYS